MAFANYLIREKQYKKTNHNKTKPKIKQENERLLSDGIWCIVELSYEFNEDDFKQLTIKDIIKQGKNGVFHPKILLELSNALLKAKKISNLCKRIPKEYSYLEVEEWKEKYMNIKDIKTFS